MSPEVISIVNRKGGVGKTTTAINVGYSMTLPQLGENRVLLIDFGPQCNCSKGIGVPQKEIDRVTEERSGIYRILKEKLPIKYGIWETKFDNLDIVPASPLLTNAKQELYAEFNSDHRLKDVMDKCSEELDQYDYIIIDCSPALELLEYNALMASDYVIIPVKAGEYSFDGISPVFDAIAEVQEINTELENLGVFMTMVDARTNLEEKYREIYKAINPEKLFSTFINQNVAIEYAAEEHQPVYLYDKTAKAAQKYLELTYEILLKITDGEAEFVNEELSDGEEVV